MASFAPRQILHGQAPWGCAKYSHRFGPPVQCYHSRDAKPRNVTRRTGRSTIHTFPLRCRLPRDGQFSIFSRLALQLHQTKPKAMSQP